jgi:ABC-type proline/glycine betaine transport system permease subunit
MWLGVWTVLLGLVATAFAVGVVMVLNKQMATDEANRRAGIADVPPFAILALLVGIVGLIFLGLFIEKLSALIGERPGVRVQQRLQS